jgi:hypothetical protein
MASVKVRNSDELGIIPPSQDRPEVGEEWGYIE